jgi:hypothetical protein
VQFGVGLFARDPIDSLAPVLKKYADVKIEQLKKPVAEARALMLQSSSDDDALVSKVQKYNDVNDKMQFYYTGAFYFTFLEAPIESTQTDADGKFTMQVPKTGAFIIAAQAERTIGEKTEHYYWVQPVSLGGQQQLTQNLANNNLTSTSGSPSVIHTQDWPPP